METGTSKQKDKKWSRYCVPFAARVIAIGAFSRCGRHGLNTHLCLGRVAKRKEERAEKMFSKKSFKFEKHTNEPAMPCSAARTLSSASALVTRLLSRVCGVLLNAARCSSPFSFDKHEKKVSKYYKIIYYCA